ncbi:MAG: hypothetical protein WC804_19300 [Sphingomonas sp.]|jgi:hypothetical protein|uniref:hypothetical protein n=1 Tax=Sphingomonas sp. TaxID=28214 RepID=UPI00356B1657
MKNIIAGAVLTALVSTSLSAHSMALPGQAAEAQTPVLAAGAVAEPLTLNAGTPITLVVTHEVNSSTQRAGDTFPLTVLNDVRIGETVVIPRGTPGEGEITWRTGKGAFGKSGKMEFSLRSIILNGQRIPISGDYRQEGEGNTVATGVGIIAVGVFAGFITGKRARVPTGRELLAQTVQPVAFSADGRLDPSYDARAAMTAAELKTPIGKCKAEAAALPDQRKQKKALEACFSKRME